MNEAAISTDQPAAGVQEEAARKQAVRRHVLLTLPALTILFIAASGPLLVDEYDSTIVVPPDWSAETDDAGNIVMSSMETTTN